MVPNRYEELTKASQRHDSNLWQAITDDFDKWLSNWHGQVSTRMRVADYAVYHRYAVYDALFNFGELLKLEGWTVGGTINSHIDIS